MAIELRLTGGDTLRLEVELDEGARAWRRALGLDDLVAIEDAAGRRLHINPRHVLYVVEKVEPVPAAVPLRAYAGSLSSERHR
jgi:hypothetical protein